MKYGSEEWTPTRTEENLLEVTKRAMERRMLGLSLCDHISNDALRQISGVKDAAFATLESELRWTRHVPRLQDGLWSSLINDWLPRELKRSVGRPPLRWNDFFKENGGAELEGNCPR